MTSSKGKPTKLGSDVTVCAGAFVQSATVGDGAMVGAGAHVLPGATIGNDAFVDAGAVVAPGTTVGAGQLWTGVPARHLRNLTPVEMSYLRSTAVTNGNLGQTHFEQSLLSVSEVERQAEARLLRANLNLAPGDKLPAPETDVEEYYKLTARPADAGILRDTEVDVAAELRAREDTELAADRAEEEFYNGLARLERVGAAIKALAGTRADRPAARDKVIADLEARDPEGAAQLRELMLRAASLSAPDADPYAKADLLRAVGAADFTQYPGPNEAKAASEALAAALASHARALPGSASAGAGAGAGSARPAAAAQAAKTA